MRKSVVGLVIPTGYSFNLDGTSIYLTMAAVFIAQATNTPMTLTQQITLLRVLLLTSKGAAGVTGSGFIVLAATLSAVGNVPVAGLALILGIDRFMSEARALTNLIGNGVATVVVGKWTGDLDDGADDTRCSNNETSDRGRGAGEGARRRRDPHAGRRPRARHEARAPEAAPSHLGLQMPPAQRLRIDATARPRARHRDRRSSAAAPAGLELATRLGDRQGRRGRMEVTLVERKRAHIWKPKLHEIAAGSMDLSAHEVDYLAQSHWHGFRYRIGEMTGLDRERREVQVAPLFDDEGARGHAAARVFGYDTLVVAVGSQSNDFGTPGVARARDAARVARTTRDASMPGWSTPASAPMRR